MNGEGEDMQFEGVHKHLGKGGQCCKGATARAVQGNPTAGVAGAVGASRPMNDCIGLVLSLGDVGCVDAIGFKTYEQLHWPGYIFRSIVLTPSASRPMNNSVSLVMPAVLKPSASRPTNNSIGLVSSSDDADCVDAINFKTYE
ncbi:hypothetical protein Taro_002680 [Colocasia esculenta]|uniref:Uncharacterized protein n=1 Tax=Colocasia esculenta TaxID=4460 RepID=A0A843TEU2_COLES|nr:hypothetical protein [Colocasia esculenta]